MKKFSWISDVSLYSILVSIILFMVVMTRGSIAGLGPIIDFSLIITLIAVSLFFSILGIVKKTENYIIPVISLILVIALSLFTLFAYVVSMAFV